MKSMPGCGAWLGRPCEWVPGHRAPGYAYSQARPVVVVSYGGSDATSVSGFDSACFRSGIHDYPFLLWFFQSGRRYPKSRGSVTMVSVPQTLHLSTCQVERWPSMTRPYCTPQSAQTHAGWSVMGLLIADFHNFMVSGFREHPYILMNVIRIGPG